MTQFNFTTNIEKRMPATGKVFCIDRMTSDYAQAHPFDVDAFIESVYQEFTGTEFEESREVLRSVWTAVLSVTNPRGDASLYPNNNGRKRAAAMKVWAKAGDYWRRGFRQGDTLPDMVPMTKITRLDEGSWIALFPKDEHLLTTTNFTNDKNVDLAVDSATDSFLNTNCHELTTNIEPTEGVTTDDTDNIEAARNQCEPQQLDLFAFQQLQQENERLQAQIAQMRAQQRRDDECAERFTREDSSSRPQPARRPQSSRRRPATVRRPQPQAVAAVDIEPENNHTVLKTLGFIAAASVALVVIYETGLLIPLGLIGLATGGLLK